MKPDIDEELARLARATEHVGPRAGFAMRVEDAIREASVGTPSRARDWRDDLPLPARRLIPMAALAAVVSLVFAARTASAFEEAVVDSIEETDVIF